MIYNYTVINPPTIRDVRQIPKGIEDWEAKRAVMRDEFDEILSDRMAAAIVTSMLPPDLQDIVFQNQGAGQRHSEDSATARAVHNNAEKHESKETNGSRRERERSRRAKRKASKAHTRKQKRNNLPNRIAKARPQRGQGYTAKEGPQRGLRHSEGNRQ